MFLYPPTHVAENTAIRWEKRAKTKESSPISEEKVNKVGGDVHEPLSELLAMGRSNSLGSTEWPNIGLLNQGFRRVSLVFSLGKKTTRNTHTHTHTHTQRARTATQSSLKFLHFSDPENLLDSIFPDWPQSDECPTKIGRPLKST